MLHPSDLISCPGNQAGEVRDLTYGRSFGLQWHITDKCDQRCQHCYIWRDQNSYVPCNIDRELTIKECITVVGKFLDFCRTFEVDPSFVITGGDPLLFHDIWCLLEYLHENNLTFVMLGNPFHLDSDICARIASLGCKAYQMSLDGLESTHDAIRMKGSFRATLMAVRQLRVAGIRTVIMSTVSRLNYQDIPELIKLIVNEGVEAYDFARYCPSYDATDTEPLLSPMEYKEFLSQVWDIYVELADSGTRFPLKDHLWKLFLYEKGLFQISNGDLVLQGCNCGVRHLTLLPNGTVYACRRFDSPVGNVLDKSFADIFLGDELGRYREVKRLEGCRDCELLNYCRGCHAVSYGVSGDFFAKDPQCWRYIE